MARLTDELLERVTAAALRLSDGRVEELVARAQAEAEAEVKELFKSAIKAALLRRAVERLEAIREAATDRGEREPDAGRTGDEAVGTRVQDDRSTEFNREDAEPGPAPPETDGADVGAALRYVYCITRSQNGAAGAVDRLPADLRGVSDTSYFDVVRFGEVEAITSPVSPAAFGEQAVHERVQDPQWVEREVRAHERVLRAAMARGPVVPFRFCTVLRGREAVLEVLRAHQDALRQALSAFAGHAEWGVKVSHRPPAESPSSVGAAEDAPSGRDYLARRHRALRSYREDREAARARAEEIHEHLSAMARAAVEIPARATRLADRDDGEAAVVFNGAYLVPDADAAAFRAAVSALSERYATQNLSCEVTGPWPPYSFVNLDLSLPAER